MPLHAYLSCLLSSMQALRGGSSEGSDILFLHTIMSKLFFTAKMKNPSDFNSGEKIFGKPSPRPWLCPEVLNAEVSHCIQQTLARTARARGAYWTVLPSHVSCNNKSWKFTFCNKSKNSPDSYGLREKPQKWCHIPPGGLKES